MKFITVRDLRTNPAGVWESLRQHGELVITHNGKPLALLSPISEADLEESVKTLKAMRAAISVRRMQTRSRELGQQNLPTDVIEREIRESRRKRSR